MNPAVLAGLIFFNSLVAEYRERLAPEARIFVAAQPGEIGDASTPYAWTQCVPESKVFVTQADVDLLVMDEPRLRFAAAHEVCHVRLHAHLLCDAAGRDGTVIIPIVRKAMEIEADRCAIQTTTGQPLPSVGVIWRGDR